MSDTHSTTPPAAPTIVNNLVTGLGGDEGYGEITLRPSYYYRQSVDTSAVFENGFYADGRTANANQMFVGVDGDVAFSTLYRTVDVYNEYSLFTEYGSPGRVYADVDATTDTVTVTWDRVRLWNGIDGEYKELSFQLQMKDLNNGSIEFTFRYGDMDYGANNFASVGFFNFGSDARIPGLYGNQDPSTFKTLLGNTGEAGVWSFTFAMTPQTGTDGDDTLNGTDDDDYIFGRAGNDTIWGRGGDDRLVGQTGDDILNGGNGADVMIGGGGADFFNGGDGFDTADFSSADDAVVIGMIDNTSNTNSAIGDTFASVEKVIGTDFDDTITGDDGRNELEGGDGDDILNGGRARDVLRGGEGNDILDGGRGWDTIDGGFGFDTLTYASSTKGVIVNMNRGGDETSGIEVTSGLERVIGSSKRDKLRADNFRDSVLEGGDGNDVLRGKRGDDTLRGDEGDDRLFGDAGDDLLRGGDGADTFIFGTTNFNSNYGPGADRITDFDATMDTLVIRTGDILSLNGYTGTVQDLFDDYATATAAGIELNFTTDTSIELIGTTDLAAVIAATSLL